MPWLRVDDRMYCNRKVLRASNDGKLLWAWAMDYSADQLTDGILDPEEVQRLAGMLNLADWQTIADELIELQLFERDNLGHYIVHDYLKYNPSRAQVLAEREKNAKRQAEWQKKERTNASANAITNGVSKTAPYPYPGPKERIMRVDTRETELSEVEAELEAATVERLRKTAELNGYSADFEAFWQAYPRRIEKMRAYKAYRARRRDGEKPEALVRAAENYARYCIADGRDTKHIKHPASFLSKDRPFEEFVKAVPEQRTTSPPALEAYDPGMRERILFEQERTRKANAGLSRPGLYSE